MIDPVSGFAYPEEWAFRCEDPSMLALAQSGLGVLTSSGRVLRRGHTTGTTAAAACKAAVESLGSHDLRAVEVITACGITVEVEVAASYGSSACFKYSGDYPGDATAGLELRAMFIRFQSTAEVDAGPGIGRWDHDTPRYRRGEPAISTTAMDCILSSITAACRARGQEGALVYLEAPEGEKVAVRTLNPRVGVMGGVSVLGSTGMVEPWDDHLGQDAVERAR